MHARSNLTAAMTAIGWLAMPASADTLHDNCGTWVGVESMSNATEGVFGARRTILDDFTVPEGRTWLVQEFAWFHCWANSAPPGSGLGLCLQIVHDFGGTPEDPERPGSVLPLTSANLTAYSEVATGNVFFSRAELESWARFDDIELGPGTYWFDAAIIGPENNFWLTSEPLIGAEAWVNYTDLGGLVPTRDVWGGNREPSFRLSGESYCITDFDRSGAIGFEDLIRLLSVWGECDHQSGCHEDLDRNGVVGFEDIVILLAAWGPCK